MRVFSFWMPYILPQKWFSSWKINMIFFPFFLQFQWKESVLCHPSQPMGTTSWFMGPMMFSSPYSTCATSHMNSVGALREPASPITPGVGLLLFALKVGKYVLITVDWRWMSHFGVFLIVSC